MSKVFSDLQVCFLNIWKGDEQKIVLGILRFASMFFFNIWNGDKWKIVLGIFRFVSMLFMWSFFSMKGVIGIFGVCVNVFYKYCYFEKNVTIKEVI